MQRSLLLLATALLSVTSYGQQEEDAPNSLPTDPVVVEDLTTSSSSSSNEDEEDTVLRSMNLTETEGHFSKMNPFPIYEEDADFTSWLSTSGVKTNNVRRGPGSSYVSTSAINSNEPLLSIPLSTIMSARSAASGRVGVMAQVNPDLPEIITLTLHLMEEKNLGSKSTYAPFINTLPSVVESPLFFNEEEMAAINGSQLHRLILSRHAAIDQYYDLLQGPVTSDAVDPPLFEEFTKDEFTWAIATVWATSKLVRTRYDNNQTRIEAMMIPMLHTMDEDFENENVGDNKLAMSDDGLSIIVFSSSSDITNADEVINVSIGSEFYDPSLFMLNHGFVPNSVIERSGSLAVTVTLDTEDPVYNIKQLLHEVNNMTMTTPYVLKLNQKTLDPMVLFSIRVKLLSNDELAKYSLPLKGEAVGIRNEYVLLRALLQTVQVSLDAFPTTLEEDYEALQRKSNNKMMEEAMKIVRMDKTILLQTKEWILKTWLDYLMGEGLAE